MGLGIDKALPETQDAFRQLKAHADSLGMTIHVLATGGVRTQSDTALYMAYRAADYAAECAVNPATRHIPIGQWRPIAPYGHSFHNYGAAFDIAFDELGDYSYDDALASLGGIASVFGLRWGGTFAKTETSGPDPVHFELDISLDEAKARWAATGPHSPAGFVTWAALAVTIVIGVIIFLFKRYTT